MRAVAVAMSLGIVGAYAVASGALLDTGSAWYLALEQPAWQPPPWVFGAAWSWNFTALAIVGWGVSASQPAGRVAAWLAALGANVALGIAWAALFSVGQALAGAAVALSLALAVAIALPVIARAWSPWAGLALLPYVAWLAIATSLAWGYVAVNPG